MDEGRRGVAVDDVVGEEAPAGWRTEEGMGLAGFPDLGVRMGGRMGWEWGTMAYGRACLKCGVSYESTPHQFVLGGSFGSGVSREFRVSGFRRRWEFSRAL